MRRSFSLAACLLLNAGVLVAQQPPDQPTQRNPPPEQAPAEQPPQQPPAQPQPPEPVPIRQPTPPDATDTQSSVGVGNDQPVMGPTPPEQTQNIPSPGQIPLLPDAAARIPGEVMVAPRPPPPERSWEELNALMEVPQRDPRLPAPDDACEAQQQTCPLPDVTIDYTLKATGQ